MLAVTDLCVSYGDAQALWDISLTVSDGERVTIVGPNGAGKTTLVNTLAGIIGSGSGSILFEDQEVTQIPAHKICGIGLAIVPEGRRLFPKMSVQDNLIMGSYSSHARLLRDETLDRVYEIFPLLKERLQQLAGTLSGGEQQMLAIGRALMAQPRLLLLDEPSLGLSPLLVDLIFEVMAQVNDQGVSILLVEQNISKALNFATRGYILEQGRIVQEGVADDLVHDDHVSQAYLGL